MKAPAIYNSDKTQTGKSKGAQQNGKEKQVAIPHRVSVTPDQGMQKGVE